MLKPPPPQTNPTGTELRKLKVMFFSLNGHSEAQRGLRQLHTVFANLRKASGPNWSLVLVRFGGGFQFPCNFVSKRGSRNEYPEPAILLHNHSHLEQQHVKGVKGVICTPNIVFILQKMGYPRSKGIGIFLKKICHQYLLIAKQRAMPVSTG